MSCAYFAYHVLSLHVTSTLTSMNNLAEVLSRQGKCEQAENPSTNTRAYGDSDG
jgi:hypothetical protein